VKATSFYRMLKKHLETLKYEDEVELLETAERAGVPPALLRELAAELMRRNRSRAMILYGMLVSEKLDAFELEMFSAVVSALRGIADELVYLLQALRMLKPSTADTIEQSLKGHERELFNKLRELSNQIGYTPLEDFKFSSLTELLKVLGALTNYLAGQTDAEKVVKSLNGHSSRIQALKETVLAKISE